MNGRSTFYRDSPAIPFRLDEHRLGALSGSGEGRKHPGSPAAGDDHVISPNGQFFNRLFIEAFAGAIPLPRQLRQSP